MEQIVILSTVASRVIVIHGFVIIYDFLFSFYGLEVKIAALLRAKRLTAVIHAVSHLRLFQLALKWII